MLHMILYGFDWKNVRIACKFDRCLGSNTRHIYMWYENLQIWWRHQMGKKSALLALCAVTGEFPSHRSVTWSFDVFFDLRLNKQSAGDLRRNRAHYDVIVMNMSRLILRLLIVWLIERKENTTSMQYAEATLNQTAKAFRLTILWWHLYV